MRWVRVEAFPTALRNPSSGVGKNPKKWLAGPSQRTDYSSTRETGNNIAIARVQTWKSISASLQPIDLQSKPDLHATDPRLLHWGTSVVNNNHGSEEKTLICEPPDDGGVQKLERPARSLGEASKRQRCSHSLA